jgi:hypothetical protein
MIFQSIVMCINFFFFFFTGSPTRRSLVGKARPQFGPLTMDPELRKENCDYSAIEFTLTPFVSMSYSVLDDGAF